MFIRSLNDFTTINEQDRTAELIKIGTYRSYMLLVGVKCLLRFDYQVTVWSVKLFIFPKQVWSLTSFLLFLTASSSVWSSSICARKQEVVTKSHYKKLAYKHSSPSLLTTAERGSSTCRLQKTWLLYILSLINSFLWFSQQSPSSVTASVVPVQTI